MALQSLGRTPSHTHGRYTRRWLQVLSRRNLVPEKWLAGVIADAGSSRSEARTALIATRLAEEQRELKDYESASYDSDVLDSEEKVFAVSAQQIYHCNAAAEMFPFDVTFPRHKKRNSPRSQCFTLSHPCLFSFSRVVHHRRRVGSQETQSG